MLARKQTLTIFLFTLVSIGLILLSFLGNWDSGVYKDYESLDSTVKNSSETYFKNIDYFILKEKKPHFSLKAAELVTNSSSKKTFFFSPDGHIFLESGEKVFYKGDKGIYDQSIEKLVLNGSVDVKTGNAKIGQTQANADQMIYEQSEDRVQLIGNVKTKRYFPLEKDWIFIDADESFMWPDVNKSRYAGHVAGRVKRLRRYEDSLYFWCNELLLDMNTNKADLYQDVRMKKMNLDASSRRGEIFLENYNKKVKYYALYDDVKLVEKLTQNKKIIERRAYSEKLEGLPSEDKVILTGYPKVYQLGDVIKGNKIVLRQSTEVVEVDDANTKFEVQ